MRGSGRGCRSRSGVGALGRRCERWLVGIRATGREGKGRAEMMAGGLRVFREFPGGGVRALRYLPTRPDFLACMGLGIGCKYCLAQN